MKYPNLLILPLILAFTSCELVGTGPEVLELEGREPEVVTWVSGQQWLPSTIAILIDEQDHNIIYLEANSSANRGYKRSMQLQITNSEFNLPLLDTLDLLHTATPVMVSVQYEQFRDKDNVFSSKWRGTTNELGGIRIGKVEQEDGIEYATGDFFMNPYVFIDRPNIQEIEGLFNNVRVFHHKDSMQAYFDKITAIEAANSN